MQFTIAIISLSKAFSAHFFSPVFFLRLKKGKMILLYCFYGRFLRTRIMTTPMIATKTNSPTIAGTKYMSAVDCIGIALGAGVAAAGSTAKDVIACDGQ